jgi:phosphatidylserine/phosphatidylglycerophosphate/cardiolipin synthase-like enzyme
VRLPWRRWHLLQAQEKVEKIPRKPVKVFFSWSKVKFFPEHDHAAAARNAERVGRMKLRSITLACLLGLAGMVQAERRVEVGFSPEGSARELVLQTIGSARRSIQMLAYSFQAPDVMQALVDARARGVEVRIVIDEKRNLGKTSRKAMDFVTPWSRAAHQREFPCPP